MSDIWLKKNENVCFRYILFIFVDDYTDICRVKECWNIEKSNIFFDLFMDNHHHFVD
jgi:hypothetical protein